MTCKLLGAIAAVVCLSWLPANHAQELDAGPAHQSPASSIKNSQSAAKVWPSRPRQRPDGGRWRLGYVESGIYDEYLMTLRAITLGLEQLGWLHLDQPIPSELTAEQLWRWLADHIDSDYLELVVDAYWRAGNFDTSQRPPMRQSILARTTQKRDLDLIIAMGTWAGQDMRAIGAPIPTVVGSVSDPLAAGIIDTIEDSGLDNLHARTEPERYERQLRLFHEIVPFRTLGIVYENSDAGRTYAALSVAEEMGKALGFDIVHCHAISSDISDSQAVQNAVDCYAKLASEHVDAVYITSHQGVTRDSIAAIADILRKAAIPSFSMLGARDVERGILLSLAKANMSYIGLFHAETIGRIFNGASPRLLDQVWIDPAKNAINLATARIIGFDPPFDILLAADEVYEAPSSAPRMKGNGRMTSHYPQ